MLYVGLSGGLNLIHENPYEDAFGHDGAAVLVRKGEVVAAIEEERLNRIKHSDKFPVNALRFCLQEANARPQDVDRFAFYATEPYCNSLLLEFLPEMKGRIDARTLAQMRLQQTFGCEIAADKIVFVPHHAAHLASAFYLSGFDRSLGFAVDGYGDFLSGVLASSEEAASHELHRFPQSSSLGVMYLNVIEFLGYGSFDEYKVMGLAPYGNPSTYRKQLSGIYELLPDGNYRVHNDRIRGILAPHVKVRKRGEAFSQQHKDLAASLQEALEQIVMHILRHWQQATGHRRLCLSGGVAHNCTMNGKILFSGLFDEVFVQPAAHDAGCALGAALIASQQGGAPVKRERMQHVFWGKDIGKQNEIEAELRKWDRFLTIEKSSNVARETAALIAQGHVVGWVQGRSEFGPRALGNRSILADPRPAENKGRINQMVKKREGYRPFAPSILEEDAREYFKLPGNSTALPFMVFVVDVREEKRGLLGAITHVDGSARLQTVSREFNRQYWELIHEFKQITGVPALLNTSFNNNVEPIVESVEDAIVCFLTTGLDYLVVGDFIMTKRPPAWQDRLALKVSLPAYVKLHRPRISTPPGAKTATEIQTTYDRRIHLPLSPELGDLLQRADGRKTMDELFKTAGIGAEARQQAVFKELDELWTRRLVRLHPAEDLGAIRRAPLRAGEHIGKPERSEVRNDSGKARIG
jgi:carbamoyltransferase